MTASIRQDRPTHSGNVIPAQHVHLMGKAPTTTTVEGTAAEPRITMTKDGDRVCGIEIVCTCGEVIRLDCVY